MKVLNRTEIEAGVTPAAAIAAIEAGFKAYSAGEVTVPPVGHLEFKHPPGEVHIKYGYRHGDSLFVVKIASGFYDNPTHGLSSGSGVMLVFSARTGFPEAMLLDEGYLTDVRTAAAGAVAARYLAPRQVNAIGVIGAGLQARMQLDFLRHVVACRKAIVWARDPSKAAAFAVPGFNIEAADSTADLAARCNLIITTTPSRTPLLAASAVRPGTHITAVGADSPGKQELDALLFARADIRVVDSRVQCFQFGEAAHSLRIQPELRDSFVELGEIVADSSLGRRNDEQISVCDLTGVAIQDVEIAKVAYASVASE